MPRPYRQERSTNPAATAAARWGETKLTMTRMMKSAAYFMGLVYGALIFL